SPMTQATVIKIHCFKCARSVEITSTDDATSYGMVLISCNLYYCSPCAKTTGFIAEVMNKN
ncbi:hypothetical protein LZ32DRAFT_546503, partial [Colletotrichum eremochloae]